VFFEETGHEATQTSIDVEADFVLFGDSCDLVDGVDDSVRVIGIGSIKRNGVAVDERAHMLDIHLIFLIESRLTHLNVEIHSSLVDSCVYGVGNNAECDDKYMFGFGLLWNFR
jgi:hypothetical protein